LVKIGDPQKAFQRMEKHFWLGRRVKIPSLSKIAKFHLLGKPGVCDPETRKEFNPRRPAWSLNGL